ncbi:MAG: UDP-N-acetylmuramyl-tripeptide synthetase [Candidatus Magasanikbacteria bacterium]|uniref:UDP-N-acetylmuramoyl-L-alanyl-D-glutamate--2, 6-diaminopimelate ligase n=1 Tax=Candidatus Magasanikbacteria bacterium CG10_big_fil_rev_8_21_14_0_10_38_6 TaxID=1974647 RepID=A0A2M6P0H8_9BACT|nr:UDP-N-acetylmuramyl-tripeptide synthetase [Candidatus Magasanikbacteria bacterium]PIR77242.1 MAG: hypothetical protein COU30_03520 [Candidatus Magasanikbacteria bacterium CG10_big_fil_rev_8_21_14_0_10_38_6]
MKKYIRTYIPRRILNLRHLYYAWKGAREYGYPSKELIVIGITGTSGKSSTAFLLRQLLEAAGLAVGSLSTIDFYIAGKQQWNDQKMTMLGKMQVQQYLRKMVEHHCDVAIVETTSEGYLQHRHRFIAYDGIVLTNLYPEHIDSHGSFENYKAAKLGIFSYVSHLSRKILAGKQVPRFCVVNAANEYANEFLQFAFDSSYLFARNDQVLYVEKKLLDDGMPLLLAKDVEVRKNGLHFDLDTMAINSRLFGEHNVSNILAALGVCQALNIDIHQVIAKLGEIAGIPGRIEFLPQAEKHGYQAIVDYAFEPKAMEQLYSVVRLLNPTRVIHVLGSTGGGRDIERRFTVGTMVGQRADIIVVTDEDPYDDDPETIMKDVASAVRKTGKKDNETLFQIVSRKEAIEKAVSLAQPGDIILVTGKGSEQAMVVKGSLIPWDDRSVLRAAIIARE